MGSGNIGRSRYGYRHHPMLAADIAPSFCQRRYHYIRNSQIIHTNGYTDYIYNGIDSPYFMEMHLFHRNSVGFRFCFRNNPEHLSGQLLHRFFGMHAVYDFKNILDIPVDMGVAVSVVMIVIVVVFVVVFVVVIMVVFVIVVMVAAVFVIVVMVVIMIVIVVMVVAVFVIVVMIVIVVMVVAVFVIMIMVMAVPMLFLLKCTSKS